MVPTAEQLQVVQDVRAGHHVSVTALPGSGKSTVAYEIIRQCDDRTAILIMFNRGLCDETTQRLASVLGDDSDRVVRAFTFHGILGSMTGQTCCNDRQVTRLLETEPEDDWYLSDYTLLIVDECQDLRPDLYRVVQRLLRRCRRPEDLRIVMLGDPHQMLYDFYRHKRADARFLTLGHQLLEGVNARTWRHHQLSRSFRTTAPVARFVNSIFPGHGIVPGSRERAPAVELVLCNLYEDPADHIMKYMEGFDPTDVLVLCSSLNRQSPARAVVRTLVRQGVPVHVGRSGNLADPMPCTAAHMEGKVRFKTFCAAKGLEAKLVIVLNRDVLAETMANSTYVAITRSRRRLVIFQEASRVSAEQLASLQNHGGCDDWLHVHNLRPSRLRSTVEETAHAPPSEQVFIPPRTEYVATADMFQYMDPQVIQSHGIESMVDIAEILPTMELSDTMPTETRSDDGRYSINVTGIMGIAIRLWVECVRRGAVPRCAALLRQRTRDPRVHHLLERAEELLAMRSEIGGTESVPFTKLPAFAHFALALDGHSAFEERLGHVSDVGFVLCPAVVERLKRTLEQLQIYVPETRTRFSSRKTIQHGNLTIVSRPTLVGPSATVQLIHKPQTEREDLLSAALDAAVHARGTAIVVNTHTGSVDRCEIAAENMKMFAQACAEGRSSFEEDMDDKSFCQMFRFTTSGSTQSITTVDVEIK